MICSTEGNHSIVCHIHIVLPNHLYWGNTAKRSTIFVRGQPQISQFRSLIRLILQPITIIASDFPCICGWFPMEKRNKGCPPPKKKTWEILKPPFHPIFQKTGEIPHFSRKNRYRWAVKVPCSAATPPGCIGRRSLGELRQGQRAAWRRWGSPWVNVRIMWDSTNNFPQLLRFTSTEIVHIRNWSQELETLDTWKSQTWFLAAAHKVNQIGSQKWRIRWLPTRRTAQVEKAFGWRNSPGSYWGPSILSFQLAHPGVQWNTHPTTLSKSKQNIAGPETGNRDWTLKLTMATESRSFAEFFSLQKMVIVHCHVRLPDGDVRRKRYRSIPAAFGCQHTAIASPQNRDRRHPRSASTPSEGWPYFLRQFWPPKFNGDYLLPGLGNSLPIDLDGYPLKILKCHMNQR